MLKKYEFSREIAESVRQYNAELHFQQKEALKAITQGKTAEELDRVLAAAFYFT